MQPEESQNQTPQPVESAQTPSMPAELPPVEAQPTTQVGQVFTPGSAMPSTPPPSTHEMVSAAPTQTSISTPMQQLPPTQEAISGSSLQQNEKKKKGFKPSKKLALLVAIPLLAIGSGAAAYVGYVVPNKPENVWRTALTNTGKGYDKLSQYATSKKDVKGMSAKGSFKISGSLAADGSFSGMSDGKNGQLTGTTSAVGLKINYDVRAIDSPGNTPDIYFKVDGIQGLGDLAAGYAGLLGGDSASVKKALNGVNGQWYFVDHTLFDQFASSSNQDFQFTSGDVNALLKAVGDSSKQYLFTNDESKMAVVVKKDVGKEKQDGRSVYHYKVGVNKENLKAYNKSLCDNLIKTKLFKLFSSGSSSSDEDFTKECNDSTGIDKIDTSQTADAWVDMHTKLIHKIRFSEKNNSNNYLDIAQDYQGGDEFPFSLGFHSVDSVDSGVNVQSKSKPDTTNGLVKMKLNMKTNAFSADANFENSGSSNDKGTFSLAVAPTSQKAKVDTPTGSKTIIELFNDLGFGDITSEIGGSQTKAKDAERKTDLNALASQLEVYYTDTGNYPTLANLNDSAWVKTNMKGMDTEALKDPDGSQAKLAGSPAFKAYSYQVKPANCTGANCTAYTLTATLDDGSTYTKQSLN
jgi:hypothetical protein